MHKSYKKIPIKPTVRADRVNKPKEITNDINIVLLGSARSGKTSLIRRYIEGIFNESYLPTIEENYTKELIIHQIKFQLQIRDTSGSFPFPAIQRSYIQKSEAFILVYSITDQKSFDDLIPIIKDINDIKSAVTLVDKKNLLIPIVLVATRTDLDLERVVSSASGEKLAQDYNCAFIEISSKVNTNVNEAFNLLIKMKINPKSNIDKHHHHHHKVKNSEPIGLEINEQCLIM